MNTRSAVDDIRSTLERMGGQFKAVLPTQAHVDRYIRVVMTSVQGNPDLLEADRTSFYAACMRCAQDGLTPDGKQAVLKIYNTNVGSKQQPEWRKTVQYEPMTEGLMLKLRLSGEVIGAPKVHVVYADDEFVYELGDSERIVHKPKIGDRGAVIAAYSIVRLKSGDTSREVMSASEIEAIRARSKTPDSGPWKTDFSEMCRKTVFKRHYKRLPRSSDLDNIINEDNEVNGLAEPVYQAAGLALVVKAPIGPEGQNGAPGKRPAALEAVAKAGGTPVPDHAASAQREPVTVDVEGRKELHSGPPQDII